MVYLILFQLSLGARFFGALSLVGRTSVPGTYHSLSLIDCGEVGIHPSVLSDKLRALIQRMPLLLLSKIIS